MLEQYQKLYSYLKTLNSPKRNSLIVEGPPGIGKTYQIKRHLSNLENEQGINYKVFSCHMSPMEMYQSLYRNRDSYIFFDDISGIVDKKSSLALLQSASMDEEKRTVEWHSNSNQLEAPYSFEFTGKIIIACNEFDTSGGVKKSILDRSVYYYLDLSYDERIDLIYNVAEKSYRGSTKKQRLRVAYWIEQVSTPATEVTLRDFFMILDYFLDCPENWMDMALDTLDTDEKLQLVYDLSRDCDSVNEAASVFKKEVDRSERQFYRYLKELRSRTGRDLF